MRGRQGIGGLMRLLLCAGFLCLAWVVLSSSQADAAERPDPVGPILGAVTDLASRPHTTSASPASEPEAGRSRPGLTRESAAPARAVRKLADRHVGEPLATPSQAVDQLRATTNSAVDHGASLLTQVDAVVPNLEQPVSDVADQVEAVLGVVPILGDDPVISVPWPSVPAAPVPAVDLLGADAEAAVSGNAAKTLALHHDRFPSDAFVGPLGRWMDAVTDPGPASRDPLAAAAKVRATGHSSPSDAPGPFPSPLSSPLPAGNTVPNQGGGSGQAEFASVDPTAVLPEPTMGAFSPYDWRLPVGPPGNPGTQPD